MAAGREPDRLGLQVALLGDAGRPASGLLERGPRRRAVAGLFEEVGADGVQAVGIRQVAVRAEVGEQFEAGPRTVRLLNDAVPSTVRAGVASGVSTLTWIAFLPAALGFGLVSQQRGVHTAAWTITAIAAAAGALLIGMAHTRPATTTPAAAVPPSSLEPVVVVA